MYKFLHCKYDIEFELVMQYTFSPIVGTKLVGQQF